MSPHLLSTSHAASPRSSSTTLTQFPGKQKTFNVCVKPEAGKFMWKRKKKNNKKK